MTFRPRLSRHLAVAALLCGLHVWMAASVSRQFSTTVDEIVHLTSGYAYWTAGDYRFQPENGNLPQRWSAWPLLFMDVNFPPPTDPAWVQGDAWQLGHRFFHESGNDLAAMLAAGRAMNALLSGLLCLGIFAIARNLFGPAGGWIALLLAVFSPTLLAHGGLITSDTSAALGFLLAVWTWWRLLHRATPTRIALAGAAIGWLALSKYSVVLFVPLAVALAGLRLARPASLVLTMGNRRWRWRGLQRIVALGALGLGTAAVSVTLIWAAYGFRFSAAPAGAGQTGFMQPWATVLFAQPSRPPLTLADGTVTEATDTAPGLVQTTVAWCRDRRVLPEAYLYGLAFVEKNARGRLAFFAGEYRMTGWREFFPTAFLVKTTLPALALMLLGGAGLLAVPKAQRPLWFYRLAPWSALLVIYWTFALTSRLNIGHRHLLPVYPVAFLFAAGATLWFVRHRAWQWLVAALLLGHATASWAIRPDYLAYFNPLAGGPENAHRLFVDSSLDWGQDLPRLRQWLDAHRDGQLVFLSYFGSGSPVHAGIDATRFGDGYFDWAPRVTPPALHGGIYCVSATMFRRVYTHVRGPWTPAYEKTYQELDTWLRHMRTRPAGAPPTELDGTPLPVAAAHARLFNYEQLQFGRLCYFLDGRPPDARAGYSILIFRLSEAEVAFALKAPLAAVTARRLAQTPAE